ncbi:hypothetical protein ACTO4W_28220 [Klebsiella michiganensis]|uniref:hypothetical protein n=1 Tax=Klebsiella michiganensis TaxID=1134687 RepID=UPI003F8D07C4
MTITLQAVNELIQSLESAGELSIKETKVMALAKAFKQLAAENVALKAACGGDGSYRNCPACTFSEYIEAPETPATDRIVAGIKADGVEEFAARLRIPGDDPFFDAIADGVAGAADSYAKQLREGADK